MGLALLLAFSGGSGWMLYNEADRLETAYEQRAKDKARYYADRAHIAAKGHCARLPPPAQRQCIREERDAARQGTHDEYDLQAQLVTSVWTRHMGIAAIIGMAVGMFGVGLIFATFRATRKGVEAAQKTHEAFVALERPRLKISAGDIFSEGRRLIIVLRAENTGKAAGYVEQIGSTPAATNGPPENMAFGPSGRGAAVYGQKTATVGTAESAEDYGSTRYVSGVVIYSSAFKPDHRSYFCFRIDIHHPGPEDKLPVPVPIWDRTGPDWPEDT